VARSVACVIGGDTAMARAKNAFRRKQIDLDGGGARSTAVTQGNPGYYRRLRRAPHHPINKAEKVLKFTAADLQRVG
jgi:hypothetical protein